jgi:hypothetical protein
VIRWTTSVSWKRFSYQTEHTGTNKVHRVIMLTVYCGNVIWKFTIFGGAFRYLSEWSNVMTEVPGQLVKQLLYLFCYGHLSFIIFKAVTWYKNLFQLDVSVTSDLLVYHHYHCNCHCHHWIYNITIMELQIWEKLERRLKFSFILSLFW